MYAFLVQRVFSIIPTIILGTMLIFAIVQLTPGGPAYAIAGADATPEFIERINEDLGLNRPLPAQYLGWLSNLAQGSLGNSLISRQPVSDLIWHRLPVTAVLSAEALLLALIIGLPLGIIAGIRSGGRLDGAIRGISGLGLALPEFWIGILAVSIFSLQLFWLPAIGYVPPSAGFWPHLRSVILPVATLSLGPIAVIIRFTRSAMIEALEGPYIRTAWSLGLSPFQVYFRFALKNAMASVVTVFGIVAAVMMGGAVLIESLFAIPGLGQLMVNAVLTKDFPVVQGVAVALLVIVLTINFLVDVFVATIDPRTR